MENQRSKTSDNNKQLKNILLSGILLLVSPVIFSTSYEAEIVRTSYGIPHITAKNYSSLGFGEGYAAAEDHICNIAHGIVIAKGESSRYHGVGDRNQYFLSDVVIKGMEIPQRAKLEFDAQPKDNQDWLTGFSAGINKYLDDTGVDNITSWCKGADWVKPVTPAELFSRFQVMAQSTPRMAGMLVAAHPPKNKTNNKNKTSFNKTNSNDESIKVSELVIHQTTFDEAMENLRSSQLGSNGWAIGKQRTENGKGMLLSNPHYPWTGTSRFWEKHLTIPGKLNVYGVHLIGAPGVGIGFNENVAWTHTVSNSKRVVFYKLDLVPGDPTSYFYDGNKRKMRSVKVKLEVKNPKGKIVSKTHTLWFSHYGPMVTIPKKMAWDNKVAFTIRDANFRNQDLMSQWKDMNLATSMEEFKQAHKKWNALPWVNTIATDNKGHAVYMDGSSVGRLSNEAIKLWKSNTKTDNLTKAFFQGMGMVLLDGSDSRFEWTNHQQARKGAVVPFIEQPKAERDDYVFNANDSYWLSHVEKPLTGYSPLYGAEASPRTLRTRMNAILLQESAGEDGKFSLTEMQDALFSNRSLTAELLVDKLVSECQKHTTVKLLDSKVNISEACNVLSNYDKTLNLESRGSVLFREWVTQYDYSATFNKGKLFAKPFKASDPVNTPSGLGDPIVAVQKLAKAVKFMREQGIPLNANLSEQQFAYRADKKIPLHGGGRYEGIANIVAQWRYDTLAKQTTGTKVTDSQYYTDKGYPITFGTSFVMSLNFTDSGPVAEAILTYGESGDPSSKHYTDQTELFSNKQWRAVQFTSEQINKDRQSKKIIRSN